MKYFLLKLLTEWTVILGSVALERSKSYPKMSTFVFVTRLIINFEDSFEVAEENRRPPYGD